MPKYLRRLILITFILIFVVAAPILLLYASGFRYDFKKHKLVKTGSLVIDSIPYGASIYLNNQLQKARIQFSIIPYKKMLGWRELGGTTPAVIDNIKPGDWLVEVRKKGYQEWKKTLPIRSGQTTFSQRIFLFLKEPEITRIIDEDIAKIEASPDGEKLAIVLSSQEEGPEFEVKILDLKNLQSTLLFSTPQPLLDLFWSPSGKKILFSSRQDWQVLDLERGVLLSLTGLLGKTPEKASWDSRDSLYALKDRKLVKIDLAGPSYETVFDFPGPATDWLIDGRTIFYIKLSGNQIYFEQSILQNGKILFSYEVPYSKNWQILYSFPANKKIFTLLDRPAKELVLINLQSPDEPILLRTSASGASWWGDELLYYNDFELCQISLEEKNKKVAIKKEIINRFSRELSSTLWYPKGGYVVFSFPNSVEIIELDSRDRRNTATLIKGEIHNFTIARDGEILWLAGKIEGERGLFRIKIQ